MKDNLLLLLLVIISFNSSCCVKEEVETKTGFVVGGEFRNTHGVAGGSFIPFRDVHGEVEKCTEFTDIDLADNKLGTANLFVSTPNYNAFKGIDLVPERKGDYINGDLFGQLFTQNLNFEDARYYNEKVILRTCTIPASEEGFTWTVQRLGPFESHGNYDWWQLGWTDVGNFKEILDKHPDGVYVDLQNVGPIEDGTWKRLGYPPIHVHHVHVIPDPKSEIVRFKSSFENYNFTLFVEQHGDYQCFEKDGGIGCLMQNFGKGNAKWINTPVTVDLVLNDVRAPRSEKLKFWFELALRWTTDKSKIKNQVSLTGFMQPGDFSPFRQQTYVMTYPAPTDGETMIWYTAKMLTDGELLSSIIHSHASIFHSSYFINASPKELGLDDPKFMPRFTYEPLYLKNIGFKDIREAATFFVDNLGSKENQNKVKPPRVICRAHVSAAVIDGFIYDRRPQCQCEKWIFKEGDDVTVITFMKHEGYPAGAHLPNVIPKTITNHATWAMYYIDHKFKYSTFGYNLYSQTGFVFGTRSGTRDMPTLLTAFIMTIVGGTTQGSNRFLSELSASAVMLLCTLLLAFSLYRCTKSIASSQFCKKEEDVQIKYVQLTTMEDDHIKDF